MQIVEAKTYLEVSSPSKSELPNIYYRTIKVRTFILFCFSLGESLFRSQFQRAREQELGAAGVPILVYSNPPDSFVAVKNDNSRYGTARNLSSVHRGSVLFLSTYLQQLDTQHMKTQNENQSQRQLEEDVNN